MENVCRRKRERSNAENELKYKQNKRILNEGLQSLNLNQYTTITDASIDDIDDLLPIDNHVGVIDSDTNHSYDTDDEAQNQPLEEEHLISVLKGGQIKYLRKVDFLVDELIRKSHRTEVSKQFCPKDFDSNLPSTLGPSPTTDHALSMPLWPVKIFDSVHFLEDESIVIHPHRLATVRPRNGSNAILLHDLAGGLYSNGVNGSPIGTPKVERDIFDLSDDLSDDSVQNVLPGGVQLAGDTTHSDWGIVDLRQEQQQTGAQSIGGQLSSPTHLSTAAVAEHNGQHSNGNNGNQFTKYRQQGVDKNSSSQRTRCMDSDDDDEDDDVMVSVWNNGDCNSSVAGSCDSTHSNLSTLSAESSPRVPYYIDADDNVYYMLDNPADGGGTQGGAGRGAGRGQMDDGDAANDSTAAQMRRNYLSSTTSSPRPQHYHLADEEEEAARYLGIRVGGAIPLNSTASVNSSNSDRMVMGDTPH
jgi:hypothetical protein